MNINEMTREAFYRLPYREDWRKPVECTEIVILPARYSLLGVVKYKIREFLAKVFGLRKPEIYEIPYLHDSGYWLMDVVAVVNGEPLCRASGCSDVIHLDGIGGFGLNWHKRGGVPDSVPPSGWSQ